MRLAAPLLLLLATATAEEDVSKLLEPIRAKHGVPALGGAIVSGDKLTAIGATGVRKLGSEDKVTIEDRWHLGSCTKAMTATLLARYVERGTITWDLTLAQAFPKLAAMHPAYRPVTLDQLLRHRAGTPADLSFDGLWGRLWKQEGTTTQQRRQLAVGVLQRPPVHDPGSKYLYSNAGYAIAGHILETRTGKSWEQLMREELFQPLGMKSAGFGAPGKIRGHATRRGRLVPVEPGPHADNPPAIGPAGTVHASLRDWAKFVSLHLPGAKSKLLKRGTVRRLQKTRPGESYAYGWLATARPWGGGRVLNHAGSNTMWFCVVWMAPERDFAVLATCNRGGKPAATACDRAASALIQHHLKKPATAPAR